MIEGNKIVFFLFIGLLGKTERRPHEGGIHMITERNIAMCIILSIVTCGIYGIYWFVCLTNDANTVSGNQGTSGGMAFILSIVTCGIYFLYWTYKQGEKLDEARSARGISAGNSGIVYLLLSVFGLSIIAYALMQDSLNKLA